MPPGTIQSSRPPKDFNLLAKKLAERAISMEDLMPSLIRIESVRGCPYTCAMCSLNRTKVEFIDRELLNRLEPCFPHLEVLTIHGDGEPLLGDLAYFVEQSVKHDFVLHMNTTGFFLTKELADLLLQTRLSIRFSIHAGTPEGYKRIMGQDFDRVMTNVKYLVQQGKQSDKQHDFWFSFIYMKANLDEVEDYLKTAHECGIRSIRFTRLKPHPEILRGRQFPDRGLEFRYHEQMNKQVLARFRERFPRYLALAEQLGIKIESSSMAHTIRWNAVGEFINLVSKKTLKKKTLPLLPRNGMCVVPWVGQFGVSQRGNVGLCCRAGYTVGNINKSSLVQIWNSEKMAAIRRSFARGRIPKLCGYCSGVDFPDYPNNSFLALRS